MEYSNKVRIVVEIEMIDAQASDAHDAAMELQEYVPRLQEDMDDFCERLQEMGHDAVAQVMVETVSVARAV